MPLAELSLVITRPLRQSSRRVRRHVKLRGTRFLSPSRAWTTRL